MDNNKNKIALGETIRRLRKQNGWTQIDLSHKLNCSQGMITAYENNLKQPSTKKTAVIAKLFDVTISELFGEEKLPEKKELNPKYLKRLDQIENLSPTDRRVVFKMIDSLSSQSKEDSDE